MVSAKISASPASKDPVTHSPGIGHADIHAAGAAPHLGIEHAGTVRTGRHHQRPFFPRAVAQRNPHRVAGRTADMDLVLMRAGGEIEALALGEDIALDEHRMHQGRLAENALEQRQRVRMGPHPVQRLIDPHVAKHFHVAFFGILAGRSGVGDAVVDRMSRVQPAARRCFFQESAADPEHRFARQQAPEEQIAIANEPPGECRAILHECGRIEKVPHVFHALFLRIHAAR